MAKKKNDTIFKYAEDPDEVQDRDDAAAEEKAKDPDTLANPTELKGGNTTGPSPQTGTSES